MLDWWIERAGPRPYLLQIKQSYDFGYNHGDLSAVEDSDKAELRNLVRSMLASHYELTVCPDETSALQLRHALQELHGHLTNEIAGTAYSQ